MALDQTIGAALHERSDTRTNLRNCHRTRILSTTVTEAYLHGVSTRKVDDLVGLRQIDGMALVRVQRRSKTQDLPHRPDYDELAHALLLRASSTCCLDSARLRPRDERRCCSCST